MNAESIQSLQAIVTRALEEMEGEATRRGKTFSLGHVDMSEFQKKTGLSRQKARTIKNHHFKVLPNGNAGKRKEKTVLSGFTDEIDKEIENGETNSVVAFEKIRHAGYKGGLTMVKSYIAGHLYLKPAGRVQVDQKANHGRRYYTEACDCFQMDWGFVNVEDTLGHAWRAACFALVCHHCGERYVEFFPDAKQENLFIGMLHAFMALGIPKRIVTDNMRSVTTGRDANGFPVWNDNYLQFMKAVGFSTEVNKARHPFTKGYVKICIR